MRRWISEHPNAFQAWALLVVWAVGIAALSIFGRTLEDAFFSSLFWVVVLGFSWYFTSRRLRRTASQLEAHGQVLAYIRYPHSLPGSLSGIWNRGIATLAPGKIEFQPAVYDTLEPSGRATSFTVLADSHELRKLGREDAKYIGELGFRPITLTTEKADIEVAAAPASLQKILDAVITPREPEDKD
ncbi:hypothetical protein AB0N24_24180 [Arthrobacter sp. NPDC093128]|uniref:hypothetical protein n=1 Tax=Arthrobacter sp. NPDC093128 TaxID=3154979 RepID=UPI0034324872